MFLRGADKLLFSTKVSPVELLQKASAFTGAPPYYEALYFLDDLIIRTSSLSTDKTSPSGLKWKALEPMQEAFGFPLSALQFRRLRLRLESLGRVVRRVPELEPFLKLFLAQNAVLSAEESREHKGLGRWLTPDMVQAVGRQKQSSASVSLTPCLPNETPTLRINSLYSLHQYFFHYKHRIEVARPLHITQSFGKYHIEARVSKGGESGKKGVTFRSSWCHQAWIVKVFGHHRPVNLSDSKKDWITEER